MSVHEFYSLKALITLEQVNTTEWSKKNMNLKSVSMRKPGRTRQGVIMLKSPISLKLGTNVRYQELAYVTECQVKILNSLGDPGSPCKNRHFARLCIIN